MRYLGVSSYGGQPPTKSTFQKMVTQSSTNVEIWKSDGTNLTLWKGMMEDVPSSSANRGYTYYTTQQQTNLDDYRRMTFTRRNSQVDHSNAFGRERLF